jgi:hypothetical protein
MTIQRIRKEHIGKRLLIRAGFNNKLTCEVMVLEISPSAMHVKLQGDGGPYWIDVSRVDMLEVLPDNPITFGLPTNSAILCSETSSAAHKHQDYHTLEQKLYNGDFSPDHKPY